MFLTEKFYKKGSKIEHIFVRLYSNTVSHGYEIHQSIKMSHLI